MTTRISGAAIAVCGSFVLLAGCASEGGQAAVQSLDKFQSAKIAAMRSAAREFRATILGSAELECKDKDSLSGFEYRCYVDIKVIGYPGSDGNQYCLASLGDVKFPASDMNKKKMIVFRLNGAPQSGAYVFHVDNGIMLFGDAGGDIKKGKRGNGDNHNSYAGFFHVTNNHTKKGEAPYLPLILHVDVNDKPLSVCAAADPKIANDG